MENRFTLSDHLPGAPITHLLFLWLECVNVVALPCDKPFIANDRGIFFIGNIVFPQELQIQKWSKPLVFIHVDEDLL